jgi:hypothetical protein
MITVRCTLAFIWYSAFATSIAVRSTLVFNCIYAFPANIAVRCTWLCLIFRFRYQYCGALHLGI